MSFIAKSVHHISTHIVGRRCLGLLLRIMDTNSTGNNNMLWARIERKITGSFISYKLPWRMEFIDIEEWMKKNMPEWTVLHCCVENPKQMLDW